MDSSVPLFVVICSSAVFDSRKSHKPVLSA
jgi:hypothetical protein